MTDMLIQATGDEPYRCVLMECCRGGLIPRYSGLTEERSSGLGLCDLKHSKSDDLVLQSAPNGPPDLHHGLSDAALQIQKDACVVYEDDLVLTNPLPAYYSDSETSRVKCSAVADKPKLKITGDFGDKQSRRVSQHISIYDRMDPEDSIRDIISENDFYRFVLFKRHYEKYLDISQKYEEARNIAYYLEEKYHEIKIVGVCEVMVKLMLPYCCKLERFCERLAVWEDDIATTPAATSLSLHDLKLAEELLKRKRKQEMLPSILGEKSKAKKVLKAERESLVRTKRDLELRLEARDSEMHDKEEELFLQLEKAVRLEEDCEKLRTEKERMLDWKNRLEREKNEAYRQLKLQAEESESTRRRLERARNDVVRQVTAIVAEKDSLERENQRLKDALKDIERKTHRRDSTKRSSHSIHGLEKEVCDLKLVAKQSATLNSQLQKGMKHLAMCRRRKCSVCAYTRTTFGEYANAADVSEPKLFSCFQAAFEPRKRERERPSESEVLAERLSQLTLPTTPVASHINTPTTLPHSIQHNMSYIDECSSSEAGSDCEPDTPHYASTTSSAPHAFSSDSGFSSELCESTLTPAKSLHRATRWTSSFRKLIRRVSKRQTTTS